jgi:hypothetical protein
MILTMLLWRWNILRDLKRRKAYASRDEEQAIGDRKDSAASKAQSGRK